jgi:hypothetical protein
MTASKPAYRISSAPAKSTEARLNKAQLGLLLRALVMGAVTLYPVWFTIHYRAVYDPDIWWHLRAGEWVLQNHSVPHTDWLSTAGQGKAWVLYSWMFDALVAALYRAFGLLGPIIIYPVAMALAISAALWGLLAELGLGFRQRALIGAASLVAMAPICSPRPGLVSVLFLVIELMILLRARRTGSSRWLYVLPVLFAFWANIHVQFVYGLLVLGLFMVETWVAPWLEPYLGMSTHEPRPPAPSALVFGVCVGATLINPYFYELHKVIVALATQVGQYRYISELQPPTFRTFNSFVELCLIVGGWVVLVRRRTLRWVPMIFLLAGTVFAFRTVRDVWFGVLASVIAMAWPSERMGSESVRERWPVIAAAFVVVLAGTVVIAKAHPLSRAELWRDTADEFPVAAVEYVKRERLMGPLYNDWNWGGFLTWTLPDIPVYVDSRTNLPGDATLERSIALWSGAADWANDPALENARLIIANNNYALTSLLREDLRFRIVYEDATAVVFIRTR